LVVIYRSNQSYNRSVSIPALLSWTRPMSLFSFPLIFSRASLSHKDDFPSKKSRFTAWIWFPYPLSSHARVKEIFAKCGAHRSTSLAPRRFHKIRDVTKTLQHWWDIFKLYIYQYLYSVKEWYLYFWPSVNNFCFFISFLYFQWLSPINTLIL